MKVIVFLDEDIPKLAPIISTKPLVVEEFPIEVEKVKVTQKQLEKKLENKNKDVAAAGKLEKPLTSEKPKENGEEISVVQEKVVNTDGKNSVGCFRIVLFLLIIYFVKDFNGKREMTNTSSSGVCLWCGV